MGPECCIVGRCGVISRSASTRTHRLLFTGKYEHSVDAKHRLAIPSEIRSRLDEERFGAGFYIIMGPNGALWLWPEKTFERMAGDIEPTLTPGAALMDFDEVTFPDSRLLDIDKSGRIRIPEEMLQDAGIGNRVVILGMRNHLEIRDPEEWDRRRAEKQERRAEIIQGARDSLNQAHGGA